MADDTSHPTDPNTPTATATTATPASSLLDLPAELLEAVADDSDTETLKSLRQVCRELHAAADRSFVETFFAFRSHTITKYSLQTLESITTVPRLRSKVKTVNFQDSTFDCDQKLDRSLFEQEPNGGTSTRIAVGEQHESYGEALKQQKDYFERCDELKSRWSKLEDELFGDEGVALPLMIKILNNLKNAGMHTTITTGSPYGPSFGHYHLLTNQLQGLHASNHYGGPCQSAVGNLGPVIKTVLFALAQSGFRVRDLRLPTTKDSNTSALATIFQDTTMLQGLTHALQDLSSLHICLQGVEHVWNDDSFGSFQGLINACTALDSFSLRLNSYGSEWRGVLGRFATIFSHRPLKSIKLVAGWTTLPEVLNMLEPHKSTLEDLEISVTVLKDPSEWSTVFTRLAERFHLSKAQTRMLYTPDDYLPNLHRFEGTKEAVRSGLLSLAANVDQWKPEPEYNRSS